MFFKDCYICFVLITFFQLHKKNTQIYLPPPALNQTTKGKLAIHEAVQNNVSTPIMESLLCNFPQSIQLCDSYGKTPICIRANRCNARSITLDEDPVYDQLSKGVQYWLDEASDSSVSDIIEVSDHENELKSENKDELSEDSEHRKPLGPGKTFGSRHELMMARSAERKGVDTTKKSAHARTSCDSDPWEVFLKMRTASAKDVSELTVVPSQGEESITLSKTAMAAMGRLKEVGDNVHILSQSAPPSKTASKKQYTSRHQPTSRKTHEKTRKTSPNKTRKKQQKSNDDAETKVLAPTTATTESEKMYYKKYQKLKTYFKQLQNTNHSLAKQMRKMQVEKEEQLHRHKSRTKTTISNLRADLAKLGDEKFVFMAAMEELKNRLDHYEVENDLLRNMYASSRKKTELDGDIHLLSYNRKNGDSQLIIAGAEESCGVNNENDVLMAVAEDEEAYVYTPSVSTNNSTLNNNIGMAAKLKVQAATMKLSDFIASSDNSTVDTSASEYNATSKGSLALTAALKMIALAKEENDDDIQTIASEALAANAKQDAEVRVSEIEPKVYNYLQDENKKLKNEVNEIQQKKDDLEDQVYRLKIALGELSLKRKKSTTKASITALAHKGDRSLDTSVGANSWPKSNAIIGRNDSTGMHDYASAPAVIRGTPFGVDINAMKNGDYTPSTSNIENADDSVSDESSSDYKEAYHALLYALDSSNRYATESFLSKRVRDLEFQLEDTIEEKQNADAILMGLNDRKPVQVRY